MLKNLSIKNKLIAIMLLVTIPSIVLGFSIVIVYDVLRLKKDMLKGTRLQADLAGEACVTAVSFQDRRGVEDIVKKLETIPEIQNGFVFDANNSVFASWHKDKEHPLPAPPPPSKSFHQYKKNTLHVALPITYQDKTCGMIYVIVSTKPLAQNTRNRVISLILVMIGLIPLSYFLALRLQGLISQPILKLARVTEQISVNPDYSLRVQKEGRDEIGILYDGFNNMLEQIQLWEKKRDRAEAEQQRLLEELADKNHELEQVIYVTSHDLRSPLVNLQGFSQELGYSLNELGNLVKTLEAAPPTTKEKFSAALADIFDSLKYIQSSTVKMDALLSGLLKLSRVSRMDSTFEMIDMNRLLSEIANGFEFQVKAARVKLQVGNLPSCFGNELQVNQVFSNLLNNALKYLAPQRAGEIKITGEEIKGNRNHPRVIYRVEDNGIGISPEYHKKIFEIFSRLNPDDTEGEGLGLTIVNKIIARHHGKVWVESEPGKGSKFFISLPTLPIPISNTTNTAEPTTPPPVTPDR